MKNLRFDQVSLRVCVGVCVGVCGCGCVGCVCVGVWRVCGCVCVCVRVCGVRVWWVGEWRLVGQGLHHTSFTCTIHPHGTSASFVCFCLSPLFHVFIDLDVVFCRHGICIDEASARQVWCSRESRHCGFAQAANWLHVLADLQLTTV